MILGFPRLRRGVPAAAVALAALAVGCGGGGAKSSASPSPALTTGGTTGALTTGGTTGAAATTGTTGATTTTGGTDPTTGSTAGGAGTTGNATTGTDTTGTTASGTTGLTTTDSSTTGGGTPIPPSPYPLRPNAIYFGHLDDPSLVSSIYADGTGRQDDRGLAANVVACVPDPDRSGTYVYVATINGKCGVYRGTTLDPAQDAALAAPVYDYVTTLQATADDRAIFVAGRNGATTLYLVDGGAARPLTPADAASVSVDGARIAYTLLDPNGVEALYVWTIDRNLSTPLAAGGDVLLPSFSKDGAWILFSSARDDANGASYDLYQIPTAGGAVERITNTPGVSELGACYNDARTATAYVALDDAAGTTTLGVATNAGSSVLATDADLSLATYWTSDGGRGRGGVGGARYQRLPKRRR